MANIKDWTLRVQQQGPWNMEKDPVSLDGSNSLPMPVQIASHEDLKPFFDHLRSNGTHMPSNTSPGDDDEVDDTPLELGRPGFESESQPVPMLEFTKGVVYEDQRMDLCKMVVGPTHIEGLLDSLDTNSFVKHFLLGNNIIGPRGARRIARFVNEHPSQMETWYLAGNCIDTESFSTMVDAFIGSPAISNVWLKRNPLMSGSVPNIHRLLTQSPNLRTLDLDLTSLGDDGVSKLFMGLSDYDKPLPIRNLYLNANGISKEGATQLGRYLASSHCQLESLYLSNNPLGDAGVQALTHGLSNNTSIIRLSLDSVGMSDYGANILCNTLVKHPAIKALSFGTAYRTEDLNGRYNYLTDGCGSAISDLISTSRTLQYLDIGYTVMTRRCFNKVLSAISGTEIASFASDKVLSPKPSRLLWFFGRHGNIVDKSPASNSKMASQVAKYLKKDVHTQLKENVRNLHGMDMTYERFDRDERRWVMSPRDVRLIDSVYRNRDAGLARRGLKRLDKWWDETDGTIDTVMKA